MAKPHTRHCLHFDIRQCRSLLLGEIANLRLREPDVLNRFARNRLHNGVDFTLRQPEVRWGPAVETLGKFPHRNIAPLSYFSDDCCDRLPYLRIFGVALRSWARLLEICRHT